jgi:Mg-chelatase subunit ChlD
MMKPPVYISLLALLGAFACGGNVRVAGDGHGGAGGKGTGSRGGLDDPSGSAASSGAAGRMNDAGATGSGGSASGSGGRSTTGSGGNPTTTGGAGPAAKDAGMGGGSDGGSDVSSCAGVHVSSPDAVLLDLLLVLDRSASMSCHTSIPGVGTRWNAVGQGVQAFLNDATARERSIGVQYFGVDASDAGTSCNSNAYEAPDVEIAPVVSNSLPILTSLARHGPGGGTPTVAALIGAYNHIVASHNPSEGREPAVVLVTDGLPDDCGSVADAVNAATVGAQNGILTFVIGLIDPGPSCDYDPNPADQDDLDSIARAGGTRHAFTVDMVSGSVAQLRDAFVGAQLTTPPSCHLALPNGPNIDPLKINVAYTPSGSVTSVVVQPVAGGTLCDPKRGGWYYDDVKNPTAIDFCPASCGDIDLQRASIDVEVGCFAPAPIPQ